MFFDKNHRITSWQVAFEKDYSDEKIKDNIEVHKY